MPVTPQAPPIAEQPLPHVAESMPESAAQQQPIVANLPVGNQPLSAEEAWELFLEARKANGDEILKLRYLKAGVVRLNGDKMEVDFSSSMQIEYFESIQKGALDHMRKLLQNNRLTIEARQVEAVNTGKKLYTQQDKLNFLIDNYPVINDLRNTFGLELD